jgi:hypothetical protein
MRYVEDAGLIGVESICDSPHGGAIEPKRLWRPGRVSILEGFGSMSLGVAHCSERHIALQIEPSNKA